MLYDSPEARVVVTHDLPIVHITTPCSLGGVPGLRAGRKVVLSQVSAVNVRQPVSTAAVDGPAQLSGVAPRSARTWRCASRRIVELLLITAVPTLFLAYRGLPSLLVTVVVVLGGALAAGSANALNCYIDRDIDEIMRRTSSRPLVRHTVAPRSALIFGLVLGVVSVTLFAATTNLLAAGLTLAAILYYVVIYTMLLKRHTSQSTLWGGVCGAAPVLIAWAAATGSLSWPAGCCSAWCSSGSRRTSGRWPSSTATTTGGRASRCSRWSRRSAGCSPSRSCTAG